MRNLFIKFAFSLFVVAYSQLSIAANDSYLVPNEKHPANLKPLLNNADPGLILGVGSDRVLFNFLMATERHSANAVPKEWEILAVDYDQEIIKFHKINQIILRITNRGDNMQYRTLRMSPTLASWEAAAESGLRLAKIFRQEKQFLLDQIDWWKEKISDPQGWKDLYQAPQNSTSSFAEVNYLFDSVQLSKLQELALRGGYNAYEVDLGNHAQVEQLAEKLLPKIFLSLTLAMLGNTSFPTSIWVL